MRIAVCDDEPAAARQITDMVCSFLPACEIAAYSRGEDLLAAAEPCDIIFLDIQMDGASGIETARQLRARGSHAVIIFITGAREHVFDAFDVAAFHYLLKPVRAEKLNEVLARAVSEVQKRCGGEKKPLFIETKSRCFSVPVDSILFLESAGRKIILHTAQGSTSFYGAIREYEKQLGTGFFRSHRGYLVNLAQITEYDAESIRFANGESAYLSRERYPDFVKQYMRFLRGGEAFHV